jgi:AbrB family looped-hinge helix DNA binding protein
METYSSEKGQVIIPAAIRRKLSIKKGTRFQIELDERSKKIVLTPITREFIQTLRGKYRGRGLLKALAVEKKVEREL